MPGVSVIRSVAADNVLQSKRAILYSVAMGSKNEKKNESFWSPLWWPLKAALVLLGHVGLGLLLVTSIWAAEKYAHWLYGTETLPELYGKVPLEWAFDTMDVGVFGLFLVWGLIEANRELRHR